MKRAIIAIVILTVCIFFLVRLFETKFKMSSAISIKDRIFFSEGNPWPEGHAVKDCCLDARLREGDVLHILLHVSSVDYRENDGGEFIDNASDTDWGSKVVWNNYHSCHIDGAILTGTLENPVSIDSLSCSAHHIDTLPEAFAKFLEDELEFIIYLLGHDAVANHQIEIGQLSGAGYPIKWSGKIALSYSGDDEFSHAFSLESTLKPLSSIWYPQEWDDTRAEETLKKLLIEADRYMIGMVDGNKSFILKPEYAEANSSSQVDPGA